MAIDQIRDDFAKLESEIASGPIVPNVTPEEIRSYLASRYDFKKPMALEKSSPMWNRCCERGRCRSLIRVTSVSSTRA